MLHRCVTLLLSFKEENQLHQYKRKKKTKKTKTEHFLLLYRALIRLKSVVADLRGVQLPSGHRGQLRVMVMLSLQAVSVCV